MLAKVQRRLSQLLLPYDTYERHAVVARLLEKVIGPLASGSRVLDVGGRAGGLSEFLNTPVVAVNPDGTGHLQASGTELPFGKDSFAAVVSIDTLEHLPQPSRQSLLEECWRVARSGVIIAAPFGSQGHRAAEAALDRLHRSVRGHSHPYLGEHVEYGLPDLEELARLSACVDAACVEWWFAGDYEWQGKSFARAVYADQQARWLAHLTNSYNRLSSLALWHPVRLTSQPQATTNRFYLIMGR